MHIFTKDDYRKIQAWLKANSIKDSDLTSVDDTIPEEDTLVLVQKINGIFSNVKISIKNLLNSTLSKIIIDTIISNAVKVNNILTVTASNVKIDNEKGTTLQDIIDWTETIENIAKGWKIEHQVPSVDEPTVRAKYVLKDSKGVPKGDTIKVYKDSAITNVYLGTTEDICDENTGEVTKKPIQNNNEALSIVYRLDTGKYSLVNVPIGIFIKEAEFDKYRGLGITENGQVFIKLANDIESSNYLHFNASGELSADGIENRILQDLGTIINSVADDGTMWGQYKKEEGTKDSPINEASRWGQYKQAEADRNEKLNNFENKIEEVDKELKEEINNASDKVLSKNINASGNLPINYNTGNGTAEQLITGGIEGVSLAEDTDSPFCEYLNYGLKCENSRGYFSVNLPELRDSIISGNTNSICISFWLDCRGIKEDSTYISFYVGESFIVNKHLSDIDGLNGSFDGKWISYNYSVTYKKQLRGYKNISLVLTDVVNKKYTNSDTFEVKCTSALSINTFITNLTIISGNSIDEYLIYPDKNGALYYNLDTAKKDIAKNTSDTAKNTSDIKEIKDNNVEVTDYNLNQNVGTENETIILSDTNLSAVEDTDSPFSGILGKCVEGLSKPSIDLMPYVQNDFNTLVFSFWVNVDAIVPTSTGLFFGIYGSIWCPKVTFIAIGGGHRKFNTLSVGSIFESTIDGNTMSATTTYEYVDKKGSWHKFVGKITNIVWKIDKSSITKFNVYFEYNFVSSGVFRFQNITCLLGNDIEYKYNPYNLIYPDGINQVQYPYNSHVAATLALKNKSDIYKIKEDLSNSSGSPLKGKYIAWVADSLLEVCANIVNGTAVPQNYNTLDKADKDEKALGYAAGWVANGSNTSYNVNWPYWISKRTRCINHIFGQSGTSIFNWAADNSKEYFYWYYKTVGRIVGYKSSYDSNNIHYTDNDGQYALRAEYVPDFIILSFGTNDNISLVNVDSLPTLDSLPQEGGEEYKNKTYKLTTDGTYWSWKDDGTGGEGIPHYSWVQVYPKTIGSYETAWKNGKWDENTLWGCYSKVITYYRQKWPNVKMGIILDGQTSREQRNAFIRICKTFAIGFLDLQTIPYPPMYNNIRGYSVNGEPYKQENDFPKGCIVRKDGKDYISLCDIPANLVWDESKWGYSVDNTLSTKSPVALGQANRNNMPSITRRSEGNYSKGENIFIWGDYLAMLYSYDQFVHPTLQNAKVKSQIVENWLLTL